MADDDVNVIGIDQAHLGRLAQEVLRMIHDELIERRAGSDEHGYRHAAATAGAANSLPGGCDGLRIAGEHGLIEAATSDSKFQTICGNHTANTAFPQPPVDLPPFIG